MRSVDRSDVQSEQAGHHVLGEWLGAGRGDAFESAASGEGDVHCIPVERYFLDFSVWTFNVNSK